MFIGAFLIPAMVCGTAFFINFIAMYYHASRAIPFGTMVGFTLLHLPKNNIVVKNILRVSGFSFCAAVLPGWESDLIQRISGAEVMGTVYKVLRYTALNCISSGADS